MTYNERNPFIISDVLYFCRNNTSRLLKYDFIAPFGAQFCQNICDSVVFTKKKVMNHCQTRLFIDSYIT